MQPIDEVVLIERLRAGDDAAYEAVVRQHVGAMLAVARRILGQDADAEDAVQEAFVQSFRKIDSFRGQSRLKTWLHRITVNVALMMLRSNRACPAVSIEEYLPQWLDDGHRASANLGWCDPGLVSVEKEETRAIVREMIDSLPDDYREVVVLRDVQQLDTKETAIVLGVGVAVVKTRLHRARAALRGLISTRFGGFAGC